MKGRQLGRVFEERRRGTGGEGETPRIAEEKSLGRGGRKGGGEAKAHIGRERTFAGKQVGPKRKRYGGERKKNSAEGRRSAGVSEKVDHQKGVPKCGGELPSGGSKAEESQTEKIPLGMGRN